MDNDITIANSTALQSAYIKQTIINLKDVIEDSGATEFNGFEFHVGDDSNCIYVYHAGKIVQNLPIPGGIFDAEAICIRNKTADTIRLAILSDRISQKNGTDMIIEISFRMVGNRFELINNSTQKMLLDMNIDGTNRKFKCKDESLEWDSKNQRYILAVQAINKPKHNEKYDYNMDNPSDDVGHFFAYYPKNGILKKLGKTESQNPTDLKYENNMWYVLTRDIGVLEISELPENEEQLAKINRKAKFVNQQAEGLLIKADSDGIVRKASIFRDVLENKYSQIIVDFDTPTK